jgi:hypothetical protein
MPLAESSVMLGTIDDDRHVDARPVTATGRVKAAFGWGRTHARFG